MYSLKMVFFALTKSVVMERENNISFNIRGVANSCFGETRMCKQTLFRSQIWKHFTIESQKLTTSSIVYINCIELFVKVKMHFVGI